MLTKLETAAQRFIRAKLALAEAEAAVDLAKETLLGLIPPGEKYTTKDGEVIAHVGVALAFTYMPDELKNLLPARIWKQVRIDAVDKKRLDAYLATGEIDLFSIRDGFEVTPRSAHLRLNFPTASKTKAA